jgi:hypothetical protein
MLGTAQPHLTHLWQGETLLGTAWPHLTHLWHGQRYVGYGMAAAAAAAAVTANPRGFYIKIRIRSLQ